MKDDKIEKLTNKKKKFNKYALIYCKIRAKHPNWKHGQIRYCTVYALRRNK